MINSTFVIDGVRVLIPPPPGYEVDFQHPTQRHHIAAYVVFGIGFPFSTFFFFQHLFVKIKSSRLLDAQSICLTLGWIFSLAMQFIQIQNFAQKIIGVHAWEMPIESAQKERHFIVTTTVINAVLTGLCKVSLGLFYYQLSPQLWWKRANWAALFFTAGHNIAVFFAIIFGCQPLEKSWNSAIPGTCINRPALYISRAALGAVSDLVLFALPIPLILGLRMPIRQKLGLFGLFSIGSITFITSIVRLCLLLPTLHSYDITWVISEAAVVMLAESHLLVICAAIPTLKQFFIYVAPQLIGETGSSLGNTGSDKNAGLERGIGTIGSRRLRKQTDQFGMTIHSDGRLFDSGESDQAAASEQSMWVYDPSRESFHEVFI